MLRPVKNTRSAMRSTLLSVKYRIETVSIPAYGGIARPQDDHRELDGRRIVAVLSEAEPKGVSIDSVRLRVLTEVIEEESLVAGILAD